MRIVCPSCEAVYQVPDATLAKVRVMRCARCAQVFEPPAVEAAADEEISPIEPAEVASPPEPERLIEPVVEPPPPPRPWPAPLLDATMQEDDPATVPMATRLAVLAAWAVSLAAVASIVVLGIVDRQQVVHAWPASARLYSALGLKV